MNANRRQTASASNRATRDAHSNLCKSAQRLLAELAAGAVKSFGKQDSDTLIAADLAVQRPDGTVAITPAGRAYLARREFSRGGAIGPFLGQHLALAQVTVDTAEGRISMTMDAAESPLVWLARRRGRDGRALIEPAQLQAGERLRADFTRAQMMPRTTSNWSSSVAQNRRGASTGQTFTDTVIASRQNVRQALEAAGPEFTGLLLDVCCFLKGLEDIERGRGWPPRSAKVVLQLGLDRLARHYGYGEMARGRERAEVRCWLADDSALAVDD